MKHTKGLLAFVLALVTVAAMAGCAKKVDNTPPTEETTTQPTTAPTQPTTSPAQPSEKEISHQHKGLYIPLGESVSVTTQDNTLSFESKDLRGGVTFQRLTDLPESTAKTSEGYAKQLKEQNPDAVVGTSTGVGFYAVMKVDGKTQVRALYVYKHMCWEVWAESSDSTVESQLIRIVGRCHVQEGQVPEISE